MNRLAFRCSLPVLLAALSGAAYALGLGELRGQSSLGERLQLEVEILGDAKGSLDPACFRLVQPAGGGEIPWLKKATLSIRKGSPSVLQIRSEAPLREPITQLALHVACGHEVGREYVLFASPAKDTDAQAPLVASPVQPAGRSLGAKSPSSPVRAYRPRAAVLPQSEESQRLAPVSSGRKQGGSGMPDRLLLSSGEDVGEPSLRLATDLPGEAPAVTTDAQRDVLRLEFRMLLAMNEQATTQLATAEKLRNMEGTLGELQQRATDFSQRVEQGTATANPAAPKVEPLAPEPESESLFGLVVYGILFGALFGLLGWFGWRKYQQRQTLSLLDEGREASPYPVIDPKRDGEREEPGVVDLPVEPVASGSPVALDLELDGGERPAAKAPPAPPSESLDSVLSVSATTLDEHFEANPVMELADIMLSFGRVKGAAQALQEYIDNNPQEALQPWIRLMDVYRMAGMKTEFEAVARNLNQNFNVEVQEWDVSEAEASLDLVLEEEASPVPVPVAPKPECLEDMPRLISTVCESWWSGDVVGYLYQLLRDNRGGQRVGFSLPVVEEILFLIELKETAQRMEKEALAV